MAARLQHRVSRLGHAHRAGLLLAVLVAATAAAATAAAAAASAAAAIAAAAVTGFSSAAQCVFYLCRILYITAVQPTPDALLL